jgi:hypothetical protein|nr:MAG TPA: hypothetical protein [Caudoviricetes sp.]
MIIFNLTIALARLDTHKSADNLLSDIANILHVGKSDLVLSSIPPSISEYRLGIETEGDVKKARFLMSKLKNAKLSPISKVQLQEIKEVKNDRN